MEKTKRALALLLAGAAALTLAGCKRITPAASENAAAKAETAAETTGAEELADNTHHYEHTGVAEALENTVEERRADRVLLAERFSADDDDAVDNDQRYEHAQ